MDSGAWGVQYADLLQAASHNLCSLNGGRCLSRSFGTLVCHACLARLFVVTWGPPHWAQGTSTAQCGVPRRFMTEYHYDFAGRILQTSP